MSILDSIDFDALAEAPHEFHIRTKRGIGRLAYATEADASDAAEARGLRAFDILRVQHVASYTVEPIPSPGTL